MYLFCAKFAQSLRSSLAAPVLLRTPAAVSYQVLNNAPTPALMPINTILDLQVRFRSNRSRRGLYDGKDIRTGNRRSHSMRATKRKFKPNVFIKRVYSEILDRMIRFHLTGSTLRSIDRAGGLDNYLLKKKDIKEGEGFVAKKQILHRLKMLKKQAAKKASQDNPTDVDDPTPAHEHAVS